MSLINTPPDVKREDWNSVIEFAKKTRQALQQLAHLRLGIDSAPTFESLTLDGLTASRLLQSNSSKALASVSDLTNWIAGTSNQVIVAGADGAVTLSLPQDIHVGATPEFAGLTVVNAITEFSTDDTLGDDSDSAVPTERAVKGYVDGNIATIRIKRLLAGNVT